MTKTGRAKDIFKPEFRFGMGGVSFWQELKSQGLVHNNAATPMA